MQNNSQALRDLVKQFFENRSNSLALSNIQHELKKNYDFFAAQFSNEEMIKLLNKISALYLEIGIKHQGKEHEEIFSKIRSHFYKSDKIEINENRTILLKGFYYFFQNDFKRAQDHFLNANNTKTDTLPYLCGKGFIEYWKQNYKNALDFFKQIFLYYRKSFPEVYYLIGICYFKLGQYDLAELCFKYLLKKKFLNQSTVAASLAIIYLIQKNYDKYYEVIQIGYNQSSQDINLVLNLAMHYFYKDEFKRCEKLAKLALQLLENFSMIFENGDQKFDNKLLKSEIYYLLGFIEQQKNTKEGYDQAYKYYTISLENNDEYYPTMFGLGQIYFYQKNYSQAQSCFEKIIAENPDNTCRECYLILPHIYMRLQQQEKVVKTFEKALFFFPNDLQLKIDFCSYLEIFDQKKCLKIYQTIYNKIDDEKFKEFNSVQLLNNMSIIFTINKKFEKSKNTLKKALELLEEKKYDLEDTEYQGIKNTILFNKSFYYQKIGQFTKSRKLLISLINQQPGFVECYLQLAKIFYREKQVEKAQFNTDRAIYVCSQMPQIKNSEFPINLKLYLHLKNKNYHEALQVVNIIKNEDTNFMLLKSALYYQYVVYNRNQVVKSKNYMQASAELCRKILSNKSQKNNYKAANLVACLLAERGRLSEAVYIFNQIQDQIKKGDDTIFNIALCEFLRQNYEKSLIVLESPLSSYKIQQNKLYPIVLTQLEKFKKAEKNWKYQLLKNPNMSNLYNLASFYKQKAHVMFQRDIKKIDELKKMLNYLKFCKKTFETVRESISNDVYKSFSNDLNFQEVERQRLLNMKINADKQLQYLLRNQEPFEAIIKKEQEKIEQRQNSKQQRKQILLRKIQDQEQQKLEEERTKKQRQEMLEKRAQENLNMINGFQFKWGEKKEKKKKSVVEKVMDESRKQKKQDQSYRKQTQSNKELQEGDQQLIKQAVDYSSDEEQEYDPMNMQYDQKSAQSEKEVKNKDSENENQQQKKQQAKQERENLFNEIVPKKRRGMILSDEEDD